MFLEAYDLNRGTLTILLMLVALSIYFLCEVVCIQVCGISEGNIADTACVLPSTPHLGSSEKEEIIHVEGLEAVAQGVIENCHRKGPLHLERKGLVNLKKGFILLLSLTILSTSAVCPILVAASMYLKLTS